MLRNNADVRRCSYFDLGLPVVSLQFIPLIEATKKPLTLTEGRLGLTHRRPNFPLTGTHHSPRSASVWRLTTCSNLLQSTGMPIPCIPEWLLMGQTAALHWIVKRGSCRLVLRPPCSSINVTKRGLTPWAKTLVIPKQESASLEAIRGIARNVTPESGLVLGEILMTLTLVEMKLRTGLIKVTDSEAHQGHGIHLGAVTKELHGRNLIYCQSCLFVSITYKIIVSCHMFFVFIHREITLNIYISCWALTCFKIYSTRLRSSKIFLLILQPCFMFLRGFLHW